MSGDHVAHATFPELTELIRHPAGYRIRLAVLVESEFPKLDNVLPLDLTRSQSFVNVLDRSQCR